MVDTNLEFIYEEVPKLPPRAPGKGREPVKWEQHLTPLKHEDAVGKSARVWTYPEKSSATSRLASVSKRLSEVTPEDNWEMKVRPVPETDPVQHGVYVTYHGTYTAEEQKANAELRAKRSQAAKDRLAAAANAQDGDTEPEQVPEAATPKQTAAQKVAAAKASRAK